MLEHEQSKAKNSITKNATKFRREVTMPEIENRDDKSTSESPETHVQDQDEINERRQVEKQSIAWPAVSKNPRKASCRHSHHPQMVKK